MNDDRDLERAITLTYEESAPPREPRGLLDDVLLTTSHTRQRPGWLAHLKEPPMRINNHLAVGSPTVRVAAVMAATILLALMVAGAGVAGSRLLAADGTFVVDLKGDGDFTTITEAVAMAEDGDTILVRPGTYDESIVLTKDVTIRGDGDREAVVVELSVETPPLSSCDAPDLPTAFAFEGSGATLQNLTIRGESARIVILGGAPLLRDLVLDGIGRVYGLDPGSTCVPTGLDINEGSTATIMDSLVSDTDIDIESGSSPSIIGNEFNIGAIWMEGADVNPVIRENVIDDSVKWGISIGAGARPVVLDNTITNTRTGIDISEDGFLTGDVGTSALVRGNTISGAQSAGISVESGASATIEDNELTGNQTGLSVRGSDAVVTGNVIREGRTGVHLTGGGSPILEENTIEGYEFGLMVGSGTTPMLRGNTICDNEQNLLLSGDAEMPDTTGNEICEDALEASE